MSNNRKILLTQSSFDSNSSESSEKLFLNRYIIGKNLAQGSQGQVKLAHDTLTGNRVAIKIFKHRKMSKLDFVYLNREVNIIQELKGHKAFVNLIEFAENINYLNGHGQSETVSAIVMEYASNGCLFDLVHFFQEQYNEKIIKTIAMQIIDAIDHMQKFQISHRDIKLENIVIDSNFDLKIIDFGLAVQESIHGKPKSSVGTNPFAPPERFLGKEYCGHKFDIFSLGVLLFFLKFHYFPFINNNPKNAADNGSFFQFSNNRQAFWQSILDNENVEDINFILLLDSLLQLDPNHRPSIEQVRNHPFFTCQNNSGVNNMNLRNYLSMRKEIMNKMLKKQRLENKNKKQSPVQVNTENNLIKQQQNEQEINCTQNQSVSSSQNKQQIEEKLIESQPIDSSNITTQLSQIETNKFQNDKKSQSSFLNNEIQLDMIEPTIEEQQIDVIQANSNLSQSIDFNSQTQIQETQIICNKIINKQSNAQKPWSNINSEITLFKNNKVYNIRKAVVEIQEFIQNNKSLTMIIKRSKILKQLYELFININLSEIQSTHLFYLSLNDQYQQKDSYQNLNINLFNQQKCIFISQPQTFEEQINQFMLVTSCPHYFILSLYTMQQFVQQIITDISDSTHKQQQFSVSTFTTKSNQIKRKHTQLSQRIIFPNTFFSMLINLFLNLLKILNQHPKIINKIKIFITMTLSNTFQSNTKKSTQQFIYIVA